MRKVAEALAAAGHRVTLLEPRPRDALRGDDVWNGSLEVWHFAVMPDEDYSARFQAGESFQRLSQEVNSQLLPQLLPKLRSKTPAFDLAVVDALYPLLAKELRLPSVHLQCSSDPDFSSAVWFHYGLSPRRSPKSGAWLLPELIRNLRFVLFWTFSWLAVGTHQDIPKVENDGEQLPWSEYYHSYVKSLLLQGAPSSALPLGAAALLPASPSFLTFVGSLTAPGHATPPPEESRCSAADSNCDAGFALVALGTKRNRCPVELLRALASLRLRAVVLVPDCRHRSVDEVHQIHLQPKNLDQAAWLTSPSLKLAVLHGGLHSLMEAVSAGVPIACVPHEGDQWANCRDIQRQGLGWALVPSTPADEAAEIFRLLLAGELAGNSVAAAAELRAAGGPGAVVQHIEELRALQQLGTESRPSGRRPFFADPLHWEEGWLLLLPMPLTWLMIWHLWRPVERRKHD